MSDTIEIFPYLKPYWDKTSSRRARLAETLEKMHK
jgi:hypothetical protein